MDEEVWKPIPSKPGMMASSWGRVLLPQSTAKMPHGHPRRYITKPRVGTLTKASKSARHHYYGTSCKKFGNMKIHRLVCEAFHGPPPNPRSVVIHMDENALNNRASNLRWGTQKENLNMPKFIEYCRTRTGENSGWAKHFRKEDEI